MEQWKTIKGNKNYDVSSGGRVRRCTSLKPSTSHCGYQLVNLYDGSGGFKNRTVHRLVLETFAASPSEKMECNHIDGDKKNNNINNLEWVSRAENVRQAYKTGLKIAPKGERHYNAKLTNDQVKNIRELYSMGYSQVKLARITEVSTMIIHNVVKCKTYKDV